MWKISKTAVSGKRSFLRAEYSNTFRVIVRRVVRPSRGPVTACEQVTLEEGAVFTETWWRHSIFVFGSNPPDKRRRAKTVRSQLARLRLCRRLYSDDHRRTRKVLARDRRGKWGKKKNKTKPKRFACRKYV